MDATSVTHIRPGARWRALGVGDVWEYRNLLLNLGLRDVKLRYKQTLLGVAWVVLQPVLSAGILTAVFGFIAAVPSPSGVPVLRLCVSRAGGLDALQPDAHTYERLDGRERGDRDEDLLSAPDSSAGDHHRRAARFRDLPSRSRCRW